MGKLLPVNDYFMVELGSKDDQWAGAPSVEEGVRSGVVVDISDSMTFFGFNTFMFDSSLMDIELLVSIHDHYKTYVGKRVYWPERSETGAVIHYDGKDYAFLKMSAIMSVEAE